MEKVQEDIGSGTAARSPAFATNPVVSVEDKANFDQTKPVSKVSGTKRFGITLIFLGLGTFGSSIPLLLKWESYNDIKSPLEQGGSPFAYELNLPFAILAGALLLIISGVGSIVAFEKNSRPIGIVALLFAVLSGGLIIYASVTIKTTLDTLRKKLEGNPITDSTFSEGEKSVMDFTGAVFNTCCLSEYDSRDYKPNNLGQLIREGLPLDDNQRPVNKCTDDVSTTCPLTGTERMFPDVISRIANVVGAGLTNVLCHCYSDQESFDNYVKIIETDGLCEKYKKIIIEDADDREVPTIGRTFNELIKLLVAIRPEYEEQLPIVRFAMVGKILPPVSMYGEPAEEIGWSCGLGYAKSDAFYMYLFIDDRVKILVIGGLLCGSLACLAGTLLGLFWLTGGGEESDDDVIGYNEDEYGLGVGNEKYIAKQVEKADISV